MTALPQLLPDAPAKSWHLAAWALGERERLGITVTTLAERARVSQPTALRLEHGLPASYANLARLVSVLCEGDKAAITRFGKALLEDGKR